MFDHYCDELDGENPSKKIFGNALKLVFTNSGFSKRKAGDEDNNDNVDSKKKPKTGWGTCVI